MVVPLAPAAQSAGDLHRYGTRLNPAWCGRLSYELRAVPTHPLLAHLGPEPWDSAFDGAYLHRHARHRRLPVKAFIMTAGTVVGVGNIYANEALYRAGIHPARPAGRIARRRYDALADAIRIVLEAAIAEGGTTLRDFVDSVGRPGYFKQRLQVYDRAGEPCMNCHRPIRRRPIRQRTTFFCASCQQ